MVEKKLPDLAHDGLGNITNLLHNQGLSDLSWLAVDEADYRAAEALPKQNLDTIPELVHALRSDDGIPHVIPLKPHTIVNQNPIHNSGQTSIVDMTARIRNRVAALIMAGLPLDEIEKRIRLEFAPEDIRAAGEAIREVIAERGLLGNVYVNAAHFPNAHRDPKERKFVAAFSKGAIFVIGGCGGKNGCNCHKTGICATFGGKRVVDEVPWGASIAAHYAPRLAMEKRPIDLPEGRFDESAVSGLEWKERIRAAFLKSPIAPVPDGLITSHTQHRASVPPITDADVEAFWARRFSAPTPKFPSVAYMKYAKRMMQGYDDSAILSASGSPELAFLASQIGLLGHTYIDGDALGGCRGALEFIRSKVASAGTSSVVPDYVILRNASCPQCRGASDGACAQICKISKIVREVPSVGRADFMSALQKAVLQKRITSDQAKTAVSRIASTLEANWSSLTAQMNLYTARPTEPTYSGYKQKAFNGSSGSDLTKAKMDPEEVRRTISHLMNTGLSGKALQASILQRYSRDDLSQVPDVGRRASVNDGVQGHFFIDPTAYPDYGRGCNSGAKYFRKRGAPYVLAASGCTGCVLQTHPGWCSKYAKGIIRQVPTHIRDKIVEARRHLPVTPQVVVENPVDKYELTSELPVDLSGSKSRAIQVEIPGPTLDV